MGTFPSYSNAALTLLYIMVRLIIIVPARVVHKHACTRGAHVVPACLVDCSFDKTYEMMQEAGLGLDRNEAEGLRSTDKHFHTSAIKNSSIGYNR